MLESPDAMFPQYGNSGDRNAMSPFETKDGTALSATTHDQAPESRLSFRPSMPGQWISAVPTPAGEEPPEISSMSGDRHEREISAGPTTPRASYIPADTAGEEVDLTPTTRKAAVRTAKRDYDTDVAPLPSDFSAPSLPSNAPDFSPNPSSLSGTSSSRGDQARAAGTALGANLMANTGLTSQSHDFASKEPVAPVHHPEMDPHASIGDVYGSSMLHRPPPLERGESFATEGTASTASMSPTREINEHDFGHGEENQKPGRGYFTSAGDLAPLAPLALHKGTRAGPRVDGSDDNNMMNDSERPTMMQVGIFRRLH